MLPEAKENDNKHNRNCGTPSTFLLTSLLRLNTKHAHREVDLAPKRVTAEDIYSVLVSLPTCRRGYSHAQRTPPSCTDLIAHWLEAHDSTARSLYRGALMDFQSQKCQMDGAWNTSDSYQVFRLHL